MLNNIEKNLYNDIKLRVVKLQKKMEKTGAAGLIVSTNVNLYYLSGNVFIGYAYIPVSGEPLYFVRRPVGLNGNNVFYIRKPEDIQGILNENGITVRNIILMEGDFMPYTEWTRLASAFQGVAVKNGSALLREARGVKTPYEISMLMESARKQSDVYANIPSLFTPGMTDTDLSIEIERAMRKAGNLGIFRIAGSSMEAFMGTLLTGDNASAPSPYDFALGGGGIHPSIPIGQNGTVIKPGTTVTVDINGNFTGYIGDLSRTFSYGNIPQYALDAHKVAIEIQDTIADMGKPGAICEELYETSLSIAKKYGLESNFMGSSQQAKFVGHGVGLEINELPVIGVRSRMPLEPGMAIALEPKFVFDGIGAVGLEDTYIVEESGLKCIHSSERGILPL